MEYFGNLVLWTYPRLRVKDLLNESNAILAKSIQEAVAKVNNAYFKSFIDFGGSSPTPRETKETDGWHPHPMPGICYAPI